MWTMERLDRRLLLSTSLANGTLTITGTPQADSVVVENAGTALSVNVNGVRTAHNSGLVQRIVVDVGAGNDYVEISQSLLIPATIYGGAGNDLLIGGGGNDRIYGNEHNDTIDGGWGDDVLFGNGGNDVLNDRGGRNALFGDSGNDVLSAGSGNDYLDGGSGTDTVSYASRTLPVTANLVYTVALLNGTAVYNERTGGGGAAGESDSYFNVEILQGGESNDVLTLDLRDPISRSLDFGGAQLRGLGGADTLRVTGNLVANNRTYSGDIRVFGGSGSDFIDASGLAFKPDTITLRAFGEAGNDTLRGSAGNDLLDGGTGEDIVDYSNRTTPVTASIEIDAVFDGNDDLIRVASGAGGVAGELDTFANVEGVIGGSGNDKLRGFFANSIGTPSDFVYGNISLWGGAGDDDLRVTGAYQLESYNQNHNGYAYGGPGDDYFFFSTDGRPHYFGEDGDDTFENWEDDSRFHVISGGNGFDTLKYSDLPQAGTTYAIPADVEKFVSSTNWGLLVGNDLDNVIELWNASVVEGRGGNDRIIVQGDSPATIYGGDGDDYIEVSPTMETGVDGYALVADGGAGHDRIIGSDQRDRLFGGSGNDTIYGQGGNDVIFGGAGNDRLYGVSGRNALFGEGGNDTLYAGTSTNYLDGGAGNDRFFAVNGQADTLQGGSGTDTADHDVGLDILISIENA